MVVEKNAIKIKLRIKKSEAMNTVGLSAFPMGQLVYTFNTFCVAEFLLEAGERMDIGTRQRKAK